MLFFSKYNYYCHYDLNIFADIINGEKQGFHTYGNSMQNTT